MEIWKFGRFNKMREEIREIFYQRAKLLQNLDKIVSAGHKAANKSKHQMSLFAEDESYSDIILEEPEDFNPFEFVEMEKDTIGYSLTYSEYERYEMLNCRYCNSTLETVFGVEFEGNKTFLAKLIEIQHKTSNYGNPFAKLVFAHDGIKTKMYLFGDLYKKNLVKCFVNRVYLITATHNIERNSLDLVNFMPADEVSNLNIKVVWASTPLKNLALLKTYLYVHMKGDDYPVNIHISDKNFTYMEILRCNIDNENLVELRKQGITIKLR